MLGSYYLIVVGVAAVAWNSAAIVWYVRNPGKRMPPILMAGPGAIGLLAIFEGVSRSNIV